MNNFFKIMPLMILLISCSRISDSYYKSKAEENYTSPYIGKWMGNYSGDENGTLILNVLKSGRIEVTRNSSFNPQEVFYIKVLEGGSIYNSPSPNSGFTLYGNMEQEEGTWRQGSSTGIWSVTKQ